MKPVRRLTVIGAIIVTGVVADQITKWLALTHLTDAGTVQVVGTVAILRYAENSGAFLGLGSNWPPFLRVLMLGAVSTLMVGVALVYLVRSRGLSRMEVVSLAMLVSGGIGNLIDRLFRGGVVVDFMNVGIGRLRTGIFNIADMLVLFGAILFVIGSYRREQDRS